tara:strand:+ start:91 stop:1239 length:1149 start_codon:yes stop_codon:yes gene_type:complete
MGMYVTGRGTDGYGTILPAISEWKRKRISDGKIIMVGTTGEHSQRALEKVNLLQEMTGVSMDIEVYPKSDENDPKAYIEVLDSIQQPACAIVAVPDHLHYEVTKDCLDAGLHTLVVKPLTPTVKETEKLIKLANEKTLYGAVEFHKRWDKQNLILRDVLKNGRLGELLYCWAEYSQRKSMPEKIFRAWVENTNPLQYLGVHYMDIVRFTTGAEPVRVMAVGQKNWLIRKGLDVYDSIQCMVEWKIDNGNIFNQTLLVNWIDPENTSAMSDQKIKFVGTIGRFESDQKDRGVEIISDSDNSEVPNPDFCRSYGTEKFSWHGYGIKSITTFLDDSLEITNNRITPPDLEGFRPTFKEALVSTTILELASKSLHNEGKWFSIKDL